MQTATRIIWQPYLFNTCSLIAFNLIIFKILYTYAILHVNNVEKSYVKKILKENFRGLTLQDVNNPPEINFKNNLTNNFHLYLK